MSGSNIPTEANFSRARAARQQRDRGLSEIREALADRFGDRGLHESFILYSATHNQFVAYLFFVDDDALGQATQSDLLPTIELFVVDALEAAGRGSRDQLNVTFEVDTDANVQAQFEGDYFARLY